MAKRGKKAAGGGAAPHYDVTALSLTIYYNREGDHDHDGMMFALSANVPVLRYIAALARTRPPRDAADRPETWHPAALARAAELKLALPLTPAQARQPHPLVRPLILRARHDETLTVRLRNEVSRPRRDVHPRPHIDRRPPVGLHLVAAGYDVNTDDGSEVGANDASLVEYGQERVYTWQCVNEGVFPFHDGGNYSGDEDGTNVHGLFGALIVEPKGTTWRDPVTNRWSHPAAGGFVQLDGLALDILPPGTEPEEHEEPEEPASTLEDHDWGEPVPYVVFAETAHREFVVVFHDEPEFVPPHAHLEPNPCAGEGGGHAGHGAHGGGDGDGHGDLLPIMPVGYRAEPMINRERTLWRLIRTGHDFKGRPVLNEEQHHSSWMFGDPVTPVFKAYIGDPVRIRFVHAGTKETHVFHLHLYEWHALPQNPDSPRIDAISVSPQTGHTIEPVWGAGNRHQVAGDVIWHCHLYPHFHEGMWGMFRTFETRQYGPLKADGTPRALLADQGFPYTGRRLGLYPDGTPIERLYPLPGRPLPPDATPDRPGYPLYIPGEVRQKSPIPPWPDRAFTAEESADPDHAPPPYATSLLAADMPPDFDYRPVPTDLERLAFNARPVPGELFTRNPLHEQQAAIYAAPAGDEDLGADGVRFRRNDAREVAHDVVVALRDIVYNSHGWHDKHGHLYYREADGDPADRAGPMEPLFFRAQHGQIVNVVLRNALPPEIPETEFDHAFPPCPELAWEGECATHVHMVKFDPICADGASVGWNYMSGARHGRRMVYRWWADQEFGTIFFHDHLFANHRQKHGLFGALLVEPAGSRFFHPVEPETPIVAGVQALIRRHPDDTANPTDPEGRMWFREFCVGIGDFIPMWDGDDPLNPPAEAGGHGDQGVMALNYRSAPLRERPGDPAYWFSSRVHGDPDTTVFKTYAGDPVWVRLVQGSHEEQHSFQAHGLRWNRFRANLDSDVRNQQTIGIAEAFTFIAEPRFGPGDYLYKLSGIDDLWLGCWGLIRAFARPDPANGEFPDLLTLDDNPGPTPEAAPGTTVRRFEVVAEQRRIVYRDPDIVDPFGLVYRLESARGPDGYSWACPDDPKGWVPEPLVLWCREGEQVVVSVRNDIPAGAELRPEPFAPEVPVERADRPVSSHVSMHADLVRYDVRDSDGTNAGLNPPQTIPPGATRAYTWDTSRPSGGGSVGQDQSGEEDRAGPLGPVLLQDMADVRNHRHHGLVGALVVLPDGATPYGVAPGQATAGGDAVWHGPRVTVVRPGAGPGGEDERAEHMVLLMQDGLRLFLNGNPGIPLPDPPEEEAGEAEKEDQGQKGFNYRTEPVGPVFDPAYDPADPPYTLAKDDPATPVWVVPTGSLVRFHLVGACDKPRNYSFTIHGVAWPEHRFEPKGVDPAMVSSESAISCGTVRTFEFAAPAAAGDHAYRSGVLKWAVPQGMWGILRVEESS